MKFASIELCKKLVELGCKSESGYFYMLEPVLDLTYAGRIPQTRSCPERGECKEHPYAFTQNDFTGCHEQARENARLVWGESYMEGYESQNRYIHRHNMIDSEDWVKYLQDSLAEAALTELTRIAQENDMGY